jgi:hypothetical protein
MLPPVAPATVGAKAMLKLTLSPAARVVGRSRPVTANAALFDCAAETTTLPPPVLVMLAGKVEVCPIMTLPNRRTVGSHVNGWLLAPAVATITANNMTVGISWRIRTENCLKAGWGRTIMQFSLRPAARAGKVTMVYA